MQRIAIIDHRLFLPAVFFMIHFSVAVVNAFFLKKLRNLKKNGIVICYKWFYGTTNMKILLQFCIGRGIIKNSKLVLRHSKLVLKHSKLVLKHSKLVLKNSKLFLGKKRFNHSVEVLFRIPSFFRCRIHGKIYTQKVLLCKTLRLCRSVRNTV